MNSRLPIVLLALVGILPVSVLAKHVDPVCAKVVEGSEPSWEPTVEPAPEARTRFYNLGDDLVQAYDSGNYEEAEKLANEYLELAKPYRCNWNYGNAIHEANRYLGLISLKHGDVDKAADYLLKSGKSTGSPTLDSVGPEVDLANELLKRGKRKEVVAYLTDVQSFWGMDYGVVSKWVDKINAGETPVLDRDSATDATPADIGWLVLIILSPLWVTAVILYWRGRRIARKQSYFAASVLAICIVDAGYAWLIYVSMSPLAEALGPGKGFLHAAYALFLMPIPLALVIALVMANWFSNRQSASGTT
jgi:hypothetical protein